MLRSCIISDKFWLCKKSRVRSLMLLNGGMVYSFIFAKYMRRCVRFGTVQILHWNGSCVAANVVRRYYNLTITKTKVSTNENPMQTFQSRNGSVIIFILPVLFLLCPILTCPILTAKVWNLRKKLVLKRVNKPRVHTWYAGTVSRNSIWFVSEVRNSEVGQLLTAC